MDEMFLERLELYEIVEPLVRPLVEPLVEPLVYPPANYLLHLLGKQSVKEILQNPKVLGFSAVTLYMAYQKYKSYQARKRQEALKREREEMRDNASGGSQATISQELCVICMINPIETVMIPCGHVCMCLLCARQVNKINFVCPLCREDIFQVFKIYFP